MLKISSKYPVINGLIYTTIGDEMVNYDTMLDIGIDVTTLAPKERVWLNEDLLDVASKYGGMFRSVFSIEHGLANLLHLPKFEINLELSHYVGKYYDMGYRDEHPYLPDMMMPTGYFELEDGSRIADYRKVNSPVGEE